MDASKRLLMLCNRENGKITRHPENLRKLDNDVEHYFVEVTSRDGIQYGLQAYGEEAISLYKETMKTRKEYLTLRSKSFHAFYHSPLSLFSFTNLRDTEFIQ